MYIHKGSKQFKKTNLALFAAGLCTFANLYLTQPLLPAFSTEFRITPATASLSLSITTGTLAVSLLLCGVIAFIVSLLILALLLALSYTWQIKKERLST